MRRWELSPKCPQGAGTTAPSAWWHRLRGDTGCVVAPSGAARWPQFPLPLRYLQLPQPLQELLAAAGVAACRGALISLRLGRALRHRCLPGDAAEAAVSPPPGALPGPESPPRTAQTSPLQRHLWGTPGAEMSGGGNTGGPGAFGEHRGWHRRRRAPGGHGGCGARGWHRGGSRSPQGAEGPPRGLGSPVTPEFFPPPPPLQGGAGASPRCSPRGRSVRAGTRPGPGNRDPRTEKREPGAENRAPRTHSPQLPAAPPGSVPRSPGAGPGGVPGCIPARPGRAIVGRRRRHSSAFPPRPGRSRGRRRRRPRCAAPPAPAPQPPAGRNRGTGHEPGSTAPGSPSPPPGHRAPGGTGNPPQKGGSEPPSTPRSEVPQGTRLCFLGGRTLGRVVGRGGGVGTPITQAEPGGDRGPRCRLAAGSAPG